MTSAAPTLSVKGAAALASPSAPLPSATKAKQRPTAVTRKQTAAAAPATVAAAAASPPHLAINTSIASSTQRQSSTEDDDNDQFTPTSQKESDSESDTETVASQFELEQLRIKSPSSPDANVRQLLMSADKLADIKSDVRGRKSIQHQTQHHSHHSHSHSHSHEDVKLHPKSPLANSHFMTLHDLAEISAPSAPSASTTQSDVASAAAHTAAVAETLPTPFDADAALKSAAALQRRTRSVIDISLPAERQTTPTSASEVFCLAYSPDSRYLACGCGDGSTRVIQTKTQSLFCTLRQPTAASSLTGSGMLSAASLTAQQQHGVSVSLPVTCLKWRPNTSLSSLLNVLCVSYANGSLSSYHVVTQKHIHTLLVTPQQRATASMTEFKGLRRGDSVIATEDSTSASASASASSSFAAPPSPRVEDQQVFALDYNVEGTKFACAGRDGIIRIYDEHTKLLLQELGRGVGALTTSADGVTQVTGHSSRVYSLKWHPIQTHLLLSGGWDSSMLVWNTRLGTILRSAYGAHLCGDSLDISADGATVLTGSWRASESLQQWDFATMKLKRNILFNPGQHVSEGGADLLYAAAYNHSNTHLAAAGNKTARLFDAKTGKCVERIDTPFGLYALAFSHDNQRLALGGHSQEGHITIIQL